MKKVQAKNLLWVILIGSVSSNFLLPAMQRMNPCAAKAVSALLVRHCATKSVASAANNNSDHTEKEKTTREALNNIEQHLKKIAEDGSWTRWHAYICSVFTFSLWCVIGFAPSARHNCR